MNRAEIHALMRVYPVYIINRATRALPKSATFDEIEAECAEQWERAGQQGRPLVDEIERRVR